MLRTMFKAKIHRVKVTHANLEYEGSVSVDSLLLRAADILPYEETHVWNVTNGSRLITYAIPAEEGSGVVCLNGAAAHHGQPGDIVILATFARMTEKEASSHIPRVVRVDEHNRITSTKKPEVGGPSPARSASLDRSSKKLCSL